MTHQAARMMLLAGSALALAACGGGGGGTTAFIPPPPVTPTPAPPAGAWFDTGSSHQFTALASQAEHVAASGGSATSTLAIGDAADVRIAFSKDQGSYLVTLPGMAQARLVDRDLVTAGEAMVAKLDFEPRSSGFTYANLAYWTAGAGTSDLKIGSFAFGTPTAAGDVPLTGSAAYAGRISAQADDAFVRSDEGFVTPVTIAGTVTMNFDFAAGKLSGEIAPVLNCWNCFETPLATLKFAQTVFSPGATSYSGKFDTSLSGPNAFSGIFAGPGAAETMARFQAPYLDPYVQSLHVMSGVWVARRP